MNSKLLIISLTIIVLNLSIIYSATTKKVSVKKTSTKKVTTKITTPLITTKKVEVKSKVTECYQSFDGYYEEKYYNVSRPVNCTTYCQSYRWSAGSQGFQSGSCSKDTKIICTGPMFVTRYNYSFIYDCCMSNLCNTPEFDANLKMKCENNKPVPKNKKLIFPVRKKNMPSVKQCYYCQKCASPSTARIINCVERNNSIKNFACEV